MVVFKIIIGVTIFILLISGYIANMPQELISNNKSVTKIGEIEYKGQFLMPVEKFIVVTSKYGGRTHPISRKAKFSFRNRFSRK